MEQTTTAKQFDSNSYETAIAAPLDTVAVPREFYERFMLASNGKSANAAPRMRKFANATPVYVLLSLFPCWIRC